MKPGMGIGQTETIELTVTKEMFAEFGGKIVHPAYSTAWMVYHMEWASRLIILPFLEKDEEGMGAAVTVNHLSPAREGERVIVKATLSSLTGNSVVTDVTAEGPNGLIGNGVVKQVILLKSKIRTLLNT
jgi:fluoroacetyl-CoA thioesterase